ncbi:MAG: adenylate/guanylate cyclase domain-containing protein [Beijerinckiaceae bacterium]|nr:adenylate/guanylate cyclase domain-containing protein [Beijerinckiaceae bacterium]
MAEQRNVKRKITAIMAADVAEYTRLISEDEEETLARLESYRTVFDDFVKRAGGRIFNTAGDGVMCEFPSAVEATRCAIDIQESLRTRNMAFPASRQMHFRIGISIGDVVERDGDLLGDGVNIAARLQSLAEPGSICVSRNVHEAVTNKISVPFRDLGSREVKNLPHPVHAFQIEMGSRDKPANASVAKPMSRSERAGMPVGAFVAGAAALAVGVAAGAFLMGRDRAAPPAAVPQLAQPVPPPAPVTPPPVELAKPAQQASVVVTENLTPAEAFDRLAKSGGIVRDPKTAPELYHNARSFEARGEAAAARRDYLAFAALGTDHLDPLLRLASLVRTQDGRAGAREVFAELSKGKGRAAALVHILQFEGVERQTRLGAFAEANPDYAPVHALIAQEFGEDRQNGQTIDDRRRELAATERFLLAEREGKLVPFFLDQSVLAQWIERAQKRESMLKAFFADGRDQPGLIFMRHNAGWIATITVPEAASRIEVKLGNATEFKPTGQLANIDPRTGKPMANPSFEMPPNQTATDIALRYLDSNGVTSPVSVKRFDPRESLIRGMRDILDRFSTSWLAFGTGHNQHLLYYTHLVSYRCAIRKVEIGYNGETPAQPIELPPCDEANPHSIPSGALPYLRIRPDIESATIRLTYVGGDVSEVKTFQRPKP